MIRVLVVDDDFRVANLHAAYVSQTPGFEVVGVARTAHSAVELATESDADLVLLDQYLPDAPGTSVIRRVRSDVMMLTAASESDVVREALRLGAVNYLLKPFTESDLVGRLRAYARFRAQIEARQSLEQPEIDRAARTLHGGDLIDAILPKGRSVHTAQLIEDAVRTAQHPVSAAEVADTVGISRGTAQRYLSDLAAQGRVVVALRYGTSGRPEHLYSWDAPAVARSHRR
ncbi:response regulator [Actinomadura alba]|uniref:Transcriptional regulatory protein n=1 Tax=Actinomadura alba TaxID=406431 RepID=A0ABR7LN87_9ACTN|nr:response regulator [Actinomadura alba]MBC6466298.1 response regulator [Actinomadura alba]